MKAMDAEDAANLVQMISNCGLILSAGGKLFH
jgi:hypothetical protein